MPLPQAMLQVTLSAKSEKLDDADKAFKKLDRAARRVFETNKSSAFKTVRNNSRSALLEVQKANNVFTRKIRNATEDAIEVVLQEIKRDAIALTPIDTGKLRQSAFVATDRLKTVVRGRVGYQIVSGPIPPGVTTNAPYAVFVHEGVGTHEAPTQHSFLLQAIQAYSGNLGNNIATQIKRGI